VTRRSFTKQSKGGLSPFLSVCFVSACRERVAERFLRKIYHDAAPSRSHRRSRAEESRPENFPRRIEQLKNRSVFIIVRVAARKISGFRFAMLHPCNVSASIASPDSFLAWKKSECC